MAVVIIIGGDDSEILKLLFHGMKMNVEIKEIDTEVRRSVEIFCLNLKCCMVS